MKRWRADECNELIRLWQAGVSLEQIGRSLHRRNRSIHDKARAMGLPPRRRPRRWSQEECEEAVRLIKVEGLTAEAAGKVLGRSRGSVIGCLHRMAAKDEVEPVTVATPSLPRLKFLEGAGA